MPTRPPRILGINPGTRYLGVALFEGSNLVDWGVKVAKGEWSKQKMEKVMGIVSGLVEQHQVDAVALKKLHPSRTSQSLSQLTNGIVTLAKRKRLQLCRCSIGELESFFCPDKRINRWKLAELVALDYPALYHELKKEKSIENLYHLRMFEAVALGAACLHQLDKQNHAQEQRKNPGH